MAFSSMLLYTGCSKDSLDKKPTSSIAPSSFWKTQADAAAWLAGIYRQLQGTLGSGNWTDWSARMAGRSSIVAARWCACGRTAPTSRS